MKRTKIETRQDSEYAIVMSNQTNDYFSVDTTTNSTFDCGNYTFDVGTGETTWHNETCGGAVENDVTLANITCGKQVYFSSTYAVVGTTVQVLILPTTFLYYWPKKARPFSNISFSSLHWLS